VGRRQGLGGTAIDRSVGPGPASAAAPPGDLSWPPQKRLRQGLDRVWWRSESRAVGQGPAKKVQIGIFGLVFAAWFWSSYD